MIRARPGLGRCATRGAALTLASLAVAAGTGRLARAEEAPQRFEIPAEDAGAALEAFARQAGRQILFPYDAVRGRATPALSGDYTPSQAAAILARAAGLSVRSAEGRTIILVAQPRPSPLARLARSARAMLQEVLPPHAPPAPALARIAADPQASVALLGEVLVTATRHPEVANRIPVSVTAQTQRLLDERGVKQISDLVGVAPALSLNQLTPSLANVAIRGVSDTGSGAATTGFYLDDTPLQKRNAGGVRNGSGNGTPLPPLFDLERIELLRGPQGTLFGAGSEGGVIRYITPAPSLDRVQTYVRSEVDATAGGGPSTEFGLALGAPLVKDRLGFRVSVYNRHTGGYLDYLDPYTQAVRWKDANNGTTRQVRGAVLWAPDDRFRANFAYYSSHERWASATLGYTPSMPNAIVVPTQCFDTSGLIPAHPQNNPMPVPCGQPGVTYMRQGFTYGPYPDLGPGRSLARDRVPSSTNVKVATLTLDYAGPKVLVKAITSSIFDETRYVGIDSLSQIRDSRSNATYGTIFIPRGFTLAWDYPDAWVANGHFQSRNERHGLTQEVRLSSPDEARPLSWVVGAFYSNLRNRQAYDNVYEGLEQLSETLYGITATQRYGVPGYALNGGYGGWDHKDQSFQDREIAGFGEADYWLSSRLKLIAGVRLSRIRFDYTEHHYGPASGFDVPTPENGGGPNTGTTTEAPVAPKFGAQYQLSPENMFYGTVAKGFRAGGVNASLPGAVCGPGLAQYGLTPNDVPLTYKSDTVWSYEVGGKFRLLDNRLQLNAAAYTIDWRNAQINIDVGNNCGIPFTGNAGTVRSQGLDLELQLRPTQGVALNAAFGYDDARYTEDAVALRAGTVPLVVAMRGQKLAVPPWTLQISGRYDHPLGGLDIYGRADWTYAQGYSGAAQQTFGLAAYAPDAVIQNTQRTNLRLGVEHAGLDVALFVNNLFNSAAGTITGGRSGCALPSVGGTAACTTYGTYNPFFTGTPAYWPRTVGLQIAYRR